MLCRCACTIPDYLDDGNFELDNADDESRSRDEIARLLWSIVSSSVLQPRNHVDDYATDSTFVDRKFNKRGRSYIGRRAVPPPARHAPAQRRAGERVYIGKRSSQWPLTD